MKNTSSKKSTGPINKKQEVQKSNDKHIDQDFEGYPKNPAKENIINPKTKADKLTAKTEKPGGTGTKSNPPKKKSDKPGDTNSTEKALANTLSGPGNVPGQPTKVDRIKKQKKG